ncbi:MAG TPA: biotin/lipoyl-binding protein [Hyphomicrobium sp.]
MRALKKRIRPDNLPNDPRIARGSMGRIIYLVLLGIFAIAVLNYFVGDFIILRADGLVLRDRTVVATTFIARVQSVSVKEGQRVKKGEPLVQLQSLDVLERIADLSFKRADLAAKATEFKIRADSVEQLLPLATKREEEAKRVVVQFQGMQKEGFVRSAPYADALKAEYEASKDRVNLTSQSRVLKEELSALDAARNDANATFEDLQKLYANGLVTAPISGAVGTLVPFVGNVYRPGEPLFTIFWGEPYVLMYLPRRYLFSIDVGMELTVTDGQHTEHGIVTDILPVTDTLPKEFQNTFQPSNRNQLAKVKLPATSVFPLNQKVTISRDYPWPW